MANWPSQQEVDAYVAQEAPKFGILPAVAQRVRYGESKSGFVGDNGSSFGPFQLHIGGLAGGGNSGKGLGDDFMQQTGLNPRDPSTWRQQVDWSLQYASQNGWSKWHAAAAVGVGVWDGIVGAVGSGVNPGDIADGVRTGLSDTVDNVYTGLLSFTQNRAAAITLLMVGIVLVLFGLWGIISQVPVVHDTVNAVKEAAPLIAMAA